MFVKRKSDNMNSINIITKGKKMTRFTAFLRKGMRLAHILTAIMAIAMLTQPTRAMADDSTTEESKPVAYAHLFNWKLTFAYGEKPTYGEVFEVDTTTTERQKWFKKINIKANAYFNLYINEVRRVVFDDSFAQVHLASTSQWFYGYDNLRHVIGLKNLNSGDMTQMFYGCSSVYFKELDFSGCNTSNVGSMHQTFYGCSHLQKINFSGCNTSNVTNMAGMFVGCDLLKEVNFTGCNTSNVTNMAGMFEGCKSLKELNVNGFNTGNVTDMSNMFKNCSGLTSLDLTNFNTGNVINMGEMFYGCNHLATIYASDDFTTSQLNKYASPDMFKNCDSLKANGVYSRHYATAERANFTKKGGYFKTYYKVGDTKHEFYGIAPLSVDTLALEDGADFVTHSTFTAKKGTFSREMSDKWGTLCLPFAIDVASTSDCNFYAVEEVSDDKIKLKQLTDTIDAGTPVLVYSDTKNLAITTIDAPVVKAPAKSTQEDKWQLTGSFTETEVPDSSYVLSENRFWLANEQNNAKAATTAEQSTTAQLKGFNAWLTPAASTTTLPNTLDIDLSTTSIEVVKALSNGKTEIYDIQGRRLDKLQKGLNIVKTGNTTKKIIVK